MHQFVPNGVRAAILVALAACTASGGGGGSTSNTTVIDAQSPDSATETASIAETAASADVAADQSAGDWTDSAAAAIADSEPADTAVAEVVKAKPATTGTQKDPGNFAPEFSKVVASTGQPVSKADLLGHWTVLWFYPAAQTSG